MSEQPKTVGGIEPVICENADGTCWISGGNFRELCSDGTWVGLDKSGSVWPTREVAQRFIDRHADQPPSGKDAVQDHKKPCLCNGICLGKERLRSNRVCRFDLAFPDVPQEAALLSVEVKRLRAEVWKWIDSGCTPPPAPQELVWYACTSCNARGVKLWRKPHDGKVLKCAACLSPDKPVDERGQQLTECGPCSDQVNGWLPAVPIGDTFYGYSSVPPQCVGWWKGLPTYDAIAQERHQAEVYRKQMAEAEAELDRVEGEANADSEVIWRSLHKISPMDRGNDEAWLSAIVRGIERIGCKLTAANSRLAKVREALTRLGKWTEPSPFAEAILTEAKAALAEGER